MHLRAILEDQKKRHSTVSIAHNEWTGKGDHEPAIPRECSGCRRFPPCPDYQAAVNALKILDECELCEARFTNTPVRLVPDPEEAS